MVVLQRQRKKSDSDSSSSDSESSSSEETGSQQKTSHKRNSMQNKVEPVAKRQNVAKAYTCIVGKCTVKKGSKAAILKHIRGTHKNYQFQCSKCPKSYESHAALKKHLLYHKKDKHYACEECDAAFMFPGQLEELSRIHTGEGLIVCEKKGCQKLYASTRAMRLHMKSHDAQDVQCTFQLKDGTICGQDCVDQPHLKQHICGMPWKRLDFLMWYYVPVAWFHV